MAAPQKFRPWIWYLHCFLSEFVLIYPTYLIMMEQTGIDPAGLALLLVVWSTTTVLFEVPSGVLGDLFPRKNVIVASGFVAATAFLIWWALPGFAGFALGFVVWSFGGSLDSGTAEAYLYETMDDPADFERVFGRTEACSSLGAAAALFAGGYAASGGYALPLALSMAAPILAAAVLYLWLPHAPGRDRTDPQSDDEPGFIETFRSGALAVWRHPPLRFIVLAGATVGALPGTFEEYVGVLLHESAFDISQVGLVYGGIWLARTTGSLLAHRLPGTSLTSPLMLFAAGGMLLLAGALAGPIMLLAGLLVYYCFNGVYDVIFAARLQRETADHHRATVTSFLSMTMEVFAVLYFLVLGAIAQWWNWHYALLTTGALSVCLCLGWLARQRTYQAAGTSI